MTFTFFESRFCVKKVVVDYSCWTNIGINRSDFFFFFKWKLASCASLLFDALWVCSRGKQQLCSETTAAWQRAHQPATSALHPLRVLATENDPWSTLNSGITAVRCDVCVFLHTWHEEGAWEAGAGGLGGGIARWVPVVVCRAGRRSVHLQHRAHTHKVTEGSRIKTQRWSTLRPPSHHFPFVLCFLF